MHLLLQSHLHRFLKYHLLVLVPIDDILEIDAGATGVKDASKGVLKNDTDPDGDSLTVNTIRTGEEAGTGTSGTIGSPLTGTYGDLTINSDGSYEYKANNAKSLNPRV